MRAKEIIKKTNRVKQYLVKVKLRDPAAGYTNIVDTIVYAANPQWARKLVKVQFNGPHVIIGQPKEIKTQYR
jgi:hypothetical protein